MVTNPYTRTMAPALIMAFGVAGCAPAAQSPADDTLVPVYQGFDVLLLDNDLVDVLVTVQDARSAKDVEDYAECVLAQHALNKGFGYARHLRTRIKKKNGVWLGDSIYTLSQARPAGLKTIDARKTARTCAENRIPMV